MADLSITAASVAQVAGGVNNNFAASVALTAGEQVYLNSNNEWAPAKADTAVHAGQGSRVGLVLNSAAAGQPVAVQEGGQVILGATLTLGMLYVVSPNNAGGIAPWGDLSTGNYINILGLAISTSVLDMSYHGAYPGGFTGTQM